MSADHARIRRGANFLAGEENEEMKWRIIPQGFDVVNHQRTVTATTPTGAGPFTFHFDKIGDLLFVSTQAAAVTCTATGAIEFPVGTIPVGYRPTVARYVQFCGTYNAVPTYLFLELNPAGSIMVKIPVIGTNSYDTLGYSVIGHAFGFNDHSAPYYL
jgi:hypothetical protein